MPPLESPKENHVEEPLPEKVARIIDSGPVNDYNFRQFQLAAEILWPQHQSDQLTKRVMDEILEKWTREGYSDAWHKIATSPTFKGDPRYQGMYSNITAEDVENELKTLPKEK